MLNGICTFIKTNSDIITAVTAVVAIIISVVTLRSTKKIAERQVKIDLFNERQKVVQALSKVELNASFVGNFDMHHINYIAFNKNFMMNMSVLDSIFHSMDHIFSINFSDDDKRYDSYFDLMKEMALIADSSKYLFDELYDFGDYVGELYDSMYKFLFELITVNNNTMIIVNNNTMIKEVKLNELEDLKKEYCSKAKLISDVYGTRLNKMMVIENKIITKRINLIKTRHIIHNAMDDKADDKL